jgi:hypothetical protein
METPNKTLGSLSFIDAIKVVRAEIMIIDIIAKHVVGRCEHRCGDGNNIFFGVRDGF